MTILLLALASQSNTPTHAEEIKFDINPGVDIITIDGQIKNRSNGMATLKCNTFNEGMNLEMQTAEVNPQENFPVKIIVKLTQNPNQDQNG